MLRYTVRLLGEHTEHPLLMGLLVLAVLFAGAGLVLGQVFGRELAEGFMTVYAVMALALGGLGYGLVFLSRGLSAILREYEPG